MRPSLPCPTSTSSKRWLARQFRDPYVQKRAENPAHFRARSAFKLLELDSRFRFIVQRQQRQRPRVIVDLGAAPGGWSQVVALKHGFVPMSSEEEEPELYGLSQSAKLARQGAWSDHALKYPHAPSDAHVAHGVLTDAPDAPPRPTIIALDLQRIAPIVGVHTLQADFLAPSTPALIRSVLPRDAASVDNDHLIDLILSDMAPNITGNAATDTENALRLYEAVAFFAEAHLVLGGILVIKYFTHPTADYFRRTILSPAFHFVHIVKPPASRAASAEGYWVCFGFRGGGSGIRGSGSEGEGRAGGSDDGEQDSRGGDSKRWAPALPRDPHQLTLPAKKQRRNIERRDGDREPVLTEDGGRSGARNEGD